MKCFGRGGTVVHRRRVLGIRSIERSSVLRTPRQLIPFVTGLPPMYTSQGRDIWSTRPFVREGTASQTLVAIHDIS